jgi:FtsH-binding integral membrane protein
MYNLYCGLGAVMMGIYIIYDTQLIVGEKSEKFSIDDYVFAAVCLYIDIVRLFLYILRILAAAKK